MQNFELWLACDDEGNAAVSMDGATEAREALTEDYESAAIRVVKLNVMLALPEVSEIDVQVPGADEAAMVDAKEMEPA
jgi:hypothetical protein